MPHSHHFICDHSSHHQTGFWGKRGHQQQVRNSCSVNLNRVGIPLVYDMYLLCTSHVPLCALVQGMYQGAMCEVWCPAEVAENLRYTIVSGNVKDIGILI